MLLQDALDALRSLSWPAIATGIASIAAVLFLADSARAWYRLSHVPGPFWASVSKYWMISQALKGRQPYAIYELTEKYGSLVRIGPNELATSDIELLRRMTALRSSYTRGSWYTAFRLNPGRDHIVSMRDDDAHTKLRKKMAPGYSGKENESMERTVDEHVARLVNLLEAKYISTETEYRPVDIAQKIQYFTLDTISDLAFGQSFGHVEEDGDVVGYIKITRAFFPVAVVLAHLPSVLAVLHSPLCSGLLPKDSDKIGFGAFIGVANKKVAERFGPNAVEHRDMIGSFVRHGLDQDATLSESLINVMAGSDTSATAIRLIFLGLLSNPSSYRKLQKEIDDGIRASKISSPVTEVEARQLPYLQAVIKEGLRVKTPVPGLSFKTVPPEGDWVGGRFIPGGTQIGISPFGIYHSKEVFGEDAGLFRPDRWLEADAESAAVMASTVDLVFSAGKWHCLGKAVALMELQKLFVELLRRFDFTMCRPEQPLQITCLAIWIIEDFPVRVCRREIEM